MAAEHGARPLRVVKPIRVSGLECCCTARVIPVSDCNPPGRPAGHLRTFKAQNRPAMRSARDSETVDGSSPITTCERFPSETL